MSQKQTRGYSERLAQALVHGPHPMSVRGLAKEMSSRYAHLRGSSYGGIRQYVEGKIESPRGELLQAMADELGVRPEWLAFNKGLMTEREEQAQKALKRAKSHEEGSEMAPWQERYDALRAGVERPSPLWNMWRYFHATEPLMQGLVIDFLESGGEHFLTWSPEDIEEATLWLVSLIEAPAQALRPAKEGVNRFMEKWPEYFTAMTLAIRAALPREGQGRPREIVTMLRAAKERAKEVKPILRQAKK